jgi:hypothetical protein
MLISEEITVTNHNSGPEKQSNLEFTLSIQPVLLANNELSIQLIPLGARIIEIHTKD